MDDRSFDKWTEALEDLRLRRKAKIDVESKEHGANYDADQFYKTLEESLDQVLSTWYEIESESWKSFPPGNPMDALSESKEEFDSIFEFEIDALGRDLTLIKEVLQWQDDDFKIEQIAFESFSSNLKKTYLIKMDSLVSKRKKLFDQNATLENRPRKRKAAPKSGGIGILTMFLFGLILGAFPSLYFWDLVKKSNIENEEKLTELRAEKRLVDDSFNILQERFSALAYGRIKNIPEIKKSMAPAQRQFVNERTAIKKTYNNQRENLLKKMSPGDRQDRSIEKLDAELADKLAEVNVRESITLKPFKKDLDDLTSILGE